MEEIKVLVTVPELEGQQKFLDQMAAVSPRLRIEQRTCLTHDESAAALTDVEILYLYKVPSHLKCANRLKWAQCHFSGIDHVSWSPIFDEERGIVVKQLGKSNAVF